jgi:hypothetical protein
VSSCDQEGDAPSWLALANGLLKRDLARYGIELDIGAERLRGGWWIEIVRAGRRSFSFELVADADGEALLEIADRLQQETLATRLGSWPSCGDHDLPLRLSLPDRPRWVCPAGTSLFIPLGSLAAEVHHLTAGR